MPTKFHGKILDGPEAELACPKCRATFWVDASMEENLVLKTNKGGRQELFAKCPKCEEEEQP